MLIPHPLLGPRHASEFIVLGDASLIDRLDATGGDATGGDAQRAFYEYQYLRDNPAGLHRELWFHEHGDRSWLVVTRDTLTHEIVEVRLAREVALERGR
ncbi:MAG: sarcosine oxidase subunit delta [Geminicoccaceae bacterium]